MILIVGLGNPGKKYEQTRHNLGFKIVDEFRRKSNFSNFRILKKSYALISEGFLNGEKIVLAKPQTFMNNSGKSVKLLAEIYTSDPKDLIVVHDDIDLPLGKIRISKGRGAAGHKGVESIIKAINSKNFVRFRIGIQPKLNKPKNTEKFVLQKFNKGEEKIIKEVIQITILAIEITLKEGLEKSMSKYNK